MEVTKVIVNPNPTSHYGLFTDRGYVRVFPKGGVEATQAGADEVLKAAQRVKDPKGLAELVAAVQKTANIGDPDVAAAAAAADRAARGQPPTPPAPPERDDTE